MEDRVATRRRAVWIESALAVVALSVCLGTAAILILWGVVGSSGLSDPTWVTMSPPQPRATGTVASVLSALTVTPETMWSSRVRAEGAGQPTLGEAVTPDPTPTATAASPPTPTPTPSVTPTPTLTPTPFSLGPPVVIGVTPTLSDTTPVPTVVPPVSVPSDAITVVLLGSDRRPEWNEWHTDAIQVVSVQPGLPAVTVLSIPRDLYVYIPGFWMSRINFADMYGELYRYEGGGPALVQQTLLYNLGIPVDHYIRVDFGGFIGVIDILGGVDIPVHCRLEDHWPYPDEHGEYPIKVLEPGVHHVDGQTALWYARSRMTTSVFSRERRQQQVLEAIWRKSRSLDILPRLPQLWEQYRHMVVTDLNLIDLLRLAEVAFRLNSQNVRTRSIGYGHVIPWTTPHGGNVFLPNWEEIEPVLAEALGPVSQAHQWRSAQVVEVWNGTPNVGWAHLAADRLHRAGYAVVVAEADRRDYAQSQLIDFTTASGGATSHLRWLMMVSPENVITAPDPDASVPYRVILGADYNTCRGF